jgi:hypothetical protein
MPLADETGMLRNEEPHPPSSSGRNSLKGLNIRYIAA